MAPRAENVGRLVGALFAVLDNIQRARKGIPDAAALAVLQIIGVVDRTEPGRGVRPSELADKLDVHRSAITQHVKALTAAGHISAAGDPDDGRSSLLFLTDSGRETVTRLGRQGMERFASFVAEWTDEEVTDLARLLEKFRSSADAVNQHTPPPSAPTWRAR
jgi:DNA-binding MarR family transcriptional regulator